jgi:translocation and assembly module TamB
MLSPAVVLLDELSGHLPSDLVIDNIPPIISSQENKPHIFPMNLNLHTQEKFYIKGLGVESSWKDILTVKGFLSEPHLVGTISSLKGKISFFGKSLTINEGHITYDEDELNNPLIWLVATRDIEGVRIIMTLSGRASSTKVSFTSSPAMPEDEVLALLLFGKELNKISAGQSMQLASAAASLNGKQGLNLFENFRRSFGFDIFELKEDSTKANNADAGYTAAQTLSIGKEFDNVRVSIDQSLGAGSKAVVSTPLSKHVYLDLEIGEKAAGSAAGLSWVMRY